jgi:hypothetical protein
MRHLEHRGSRESDDDCGSGTAREEGGGKRERA